jgi:enoyl-CoA hydratase/carnithine racemase
MESTSATTQQELLLDNEAGVARLTLNRPERRNALSQALLIELGSALDRVAQDSSVRVVVLGAAGKVFCSGHDLSEISGRTEADHRELFTICARVMQRLRSLPQPVIARVHGLATAAGCQLVASCDLAVATREAQFATPGVKIGLFCTTPMVPLVRAISPKVAMEMLLTGQPISADKALAVGLINRVVPAAQLDATIQEYCEAIMASSAATIRIGKEAFYNHIDLDERSAYTQAVDVITRNAQQADAREGIAAFLEKRSPKWELP